MERTLTLPSHSPRPARHPSVAPVGRRRRCARAEPYMHAAFAVAGALLYNEVVEIEARQSKAIDDLLAKKGMRPSPKYD